MTHTTMGHIFTVLCFLLQEGCVSVSDVNCSLARLPLISALDVFSHPELHNSHDRAACNKSMPLRLCILCVMQSVATAITFVGVRT